MPTLCSRCKIILRAKLTFSAGLNVEKAEIVNILEDNIEDLKTGGKDDTEIKLPFRGYEIKTVRLTVTPSKKLRRQSEGWVKI